MLFVINKLAEFYHEAFLLQVSIFSTTAKQLSSMTTYALSTAPALNLLKSEIREQLLQFQIGQDVLIDKSC